MSRPRSTDTHCPQGLHERTPENMYVIRNYEAGRVVRVEYRCKLCQRERDRAKKTHCRYGHPLSGTNVAWEGTRRRCRTCRNEKDRRARQRLREQQPKVDMTPIPFVETQPGWRNKAKCVGRDDWLAEDEMTQQRASRSCLSCPVAAECARVALSQREPWGVWAGVIVDGRLSRQKRLLLERMARLDEVAS